MSSNLYLEHVLFSFDAEHTTVFVCIKDKGNEVRPSQFKWFYQEYESKRSAIGIMKEWRKSAPSFLQWVQRKPVLPGLYSEIKEVPQSISIESSQARHSKDLSNLMKTTRQEIQTHLGNLEQIRKDAKT